MQDVRRLRPTAAKLARIMGGATFADTLAVCPFRSVISSRWPPTIACTIACIDDEMFPMSNDMLRRLLDTLRRGEAVLLLSNERGIRDRGKAALMALAGLPGGMAS